DFDHGLNNAVARIREVLDDSSHTPRYVETIPRRGYRFIAPLADVLSAARPGTAGPSVPATEKRFPSTRLRALLGGVAVLALIIIAFLLYRGSGAKGTRHPAIKSLAVLPLKNLSGDAAQEYFADGMTEAVIGRLSMIRGLRVISRTSVMRFKDTQLSVPE